MMQTNGPNQRSRERALHVWLDWLLNMEYAEHITREYRLKIQGMLYADDYEMYSLAKVIIQDDINKYDEAIKQGKIKKNGHYYKHGSPGL